MHTSDQLTLLYCKESLNARILGFTEDTPWINVVHDDVEGNKNDVL